MSNTTINPNPVDYLKYVAAEAGAIVEQVQAQLGGLDLSRPVRADDVETALSQLDTVRHVLTEAAAVFCRDGHDLDTYADGRPVRSRLDIERGNSFEYTWHPYPDHRDNRPRELGTVTTTSGARKRLLITAPGVLDAAEPLRSVP